MFRGSLFIIAGILSLDPCLVPIFSVVAEEPSPLMAELHISPNYLSEIGRSDDALQERTGNRELDAGEFLRSVPGVGAGRMGGHGLEPVIQGQQQTQLNVTDSGAFIHGGCPNRMDPPSSALPIKLYDNLLVDHGYRTVTNGSNGSGGSVTLLRNSPSSQINGSVLQGSAGTEVGTNGSAFSSFADVGHRGNSFFERVSAQLSKSDDYSDGRGKDVRSQFLQWSTILDLGAGEEKEDFLKASLLTSRTSDATFEGATMDEPETTAIMPKVEGHLMVKEGVISKLYFRTAAAFVDHLMDNYSLRPQGGMLMRTPTTSNTLSGAIGATADLNNLLLNSGLDMQIVDRSARRYGGMMSSNVNSLGSVLWPDLLTTDIGLFLEGRRALDDTQFLTVGLRGDAVNYRASAVDEKYMMPTGIFSSANQLYAKYYGSSFETGTEFRPTGLIRYENAIADSLDGSLSFAYVTRFADSTEKTLASQSAKGNWVGNPGIDPEQHFLAQAGLAYHDEVVELESFIYFNYVHDYILRDTARGQEGILLADGASIYRNIAADLSGGQLNAGYKFSTEFKLLHEVSYTYGQDLDRGEALPQIPPVSGAATLIYEGEKFASGLRMHYATTQTRVDTDPLSGTGRDVGTTAGYGVWDIFASYRFLPSLEFRISLQNLTDKVYANHLNRANAFDPAESRINEPGRSVVFGLTGKIPS